jgi:hypothetical protein
VDASVLTVCNTLARAAALLVDVGAHVQRHCFVRADEATLPALDARAAVAAPSSQRRVRGEMLCQALLCGRLERTVRTRIRHTRSTFVTVRYQPYRAIVCFMAVAVDFFAVIGPELGGGLVLTQLLLLMTMM